MFPIRDHNPSGRVPFVTYGLIAANVALFFSYLPLFEEPYELMLLYAEWGMVPARLEAGQGLHTLITSQFLHGGWLHLGFNMLFLWIFGDNMEEEWGHLPYLLFYLACGAGAALLQLLSDPGSMIPMVGASGAIAGVLGGYLLMFPRARVDVFLFLVIYFRVIPVPAWLMLGIWFALQVIGGIAAPPGEGGVAYWAHAGGFALGLVLTVPIWLRRGGVAYWGRNFGQPPHPEATYRIGKTHVPVVRRRKTPTRTTGGSGPKGPPPLPGQSRHPAPRAPKGPPPVPQQDNEREKPRQGPPPVPEAGRVPKVPRRK